MRMINYVHIEPGIHDCEFTDVAMTATGQKPTKFKQCIICGAVKNDPHPKMVTVDYSFITNLSYTNK